MNRRHQTTIILVILTTLLCGCAGVGNSPDNTVSGRVRGLPDSWRGQPVFIYAAAFTGADTGEGYYVLEPDINPHARLGWTGRFTIPAVPEGSFILLAGPTPEEAKMLLDSEGVPLIITGGIQDQQIGTVFVSG